MKPATVFLGEMTNPEVEAFLKTHHTVIVPTGATEQHGPHAPLLTDVLIPQEVARRVAPQIGARRGAADQLRAVVSARRLHRPRAHPHPDVHGARSKTCASSFARVGFKRIIFLNGHYDNTYAIAYACANAAERMPKDVKAFPVNYWDGADRPRRSPSSRA